MQSLAGIPLNESLDSLMDTKYNVKKISSFVKKEIKKHVKNPKEWDIDVFEGQSMTLVDIILKKAGNEIHLSLNGDAELQLSSRGYDVERRNSEKVKSAKVLWDAVREVESA